MAFTLLPRSLTTLALAAAVALPIAGCGSSSTAGGDPGADPAALLPASAPVYVEAQVRPTGALGDNALAVARKLLGTSDPGGMIVGLLGGKLNDDNLTYAKDIAPWLGQRAGLVVTGVGAGGKNADVVAAVASKDDDAAQKFVDGRQGTSKQTYRDVSYQYDAGHNLALAVVDHALIVGTQRGFKSAIDARSGAKLADAAAFKKARETVGSDGLGFLYADPSRLFDIALSAAPGLSGADASGPMAGPLSAGTALRGLLGGSGLQAITASLDAASDALRIDAAAIGLKAGSASSLLSSGSGGPAAVAAVPADAWLSAGIGDVGTTVTRALSQMGGSAATGGVDPATLLQGLQAQLGIDIQKDLLSWMGDAALFVRGTTKDEIGGALVVQSKDPAASRAAIKKLEKAFGTFGVQTGALGSGTGGAEGFSVKLDQLPASIQVAAKDDKFVVAYGKGALADALGGGAKLGDSAAFKTAAGLLDDAKPSVFIDTPQAIKLLESLQGTNKQFAKLGPVLEKLGPAAAGLASKDGVIHLKAAVAVP
jgi:hypothetical protein